MSVYCLHMYIKCADLAPDVHIMARFGFGLCHAVTARSSSSSCSALTLSAELLFSHSASPVHCCLQSCCLRCVLHSTTCSNERLVWLPNHACLRQNIAWGRLKHKAVAAAAAAGAVFNEGRSGQGTAGVQGVVMALAHCQVAVRPPAQQAPWEVAPESHSMLIQLHIHLQAQPLVARAQGKLCISAASLTSLLCGQSSLRPSHLL